MYIYLFGAGASAGRNSSYGNVSYINKLIEGQNKAWVKEHESILQVTPTTFNISNRLNFLITRINQLKSQIRIGNNISKLIEIMHDFEWLNNKLSHEPYLDILAETEYNTLNKENFFKLTRITSIFFLLNQCFFGVDTRYKTLFTTLMSLTRSGHIPDEVKFFTWNYDYQLEEAMIEKRFHWLHEKKTFEENIITKRIVRYNKIWDSPAPEQLTKTLLYKINGCCATLTNPLNSSNKNIIQEIIVASNPIYNNINEINDLNHIAKFINVIIEYNDELLSKEKSFNNSISYSWLDDRKQLFRNIKISIPEKASTLIVFGYSFPTLNSLVDKAFFKGTNIKKIYLQCQEKDKKTIQSRIEGVAQRKLDIEIIDGIDDIHVPFELQNLLFKKL